MNPPNHTSSLEILPNNILKLSLQSNKTENIGKFKFRIRCNGQEIINMTSQWSEVNSYFFEIKKEGVYYAESWINIRDSEKNFSKPCYFSPERIREQYLKWKETAKGKELVIPNIYSPQYPFGNIIIISIIEIPEEKLKAIQDFAQKSQLHLTCYFDEGLFILSSYEFIKDKKNQEYIFSGITRNEKKLLIGCEDTKKYVEDISSLKNSIGEYCLLIKSENNLELSSDYFGINRVFYYQTDNIFVATNNYQALLLVLKKCGENLVLCEKKVKANFLDMSILFQNNWTWQMDVEKIFEIPIDMKIVLANKKISLEKTDLYDEIRNPLKFCDAEYENLLFKGKNEIIDNIKITLEHPDYEYVRVDLTAGMDSRLIYGALTNLPNHLTSKVRIRSEKDKDVDFETAIIINNVYKYKWDDLPVEYSAEIDENKNIPNIPIARFLGNYYAGWTIRAPQRIAKTIHLSGGCGEICTRPFLRYWFPNASTLENILSYYVLRKDRLSLFPLVADSFEQMFKETFNYIPGRSVLEKFDNHYLYFRNGYHFSYNYYNDIICSAWTPLQSKSSFRAKLMAWGEGVDMKVAYDLLNIMNPILSQYKFGGERQNVEKIQIENKLYMPRIEIAYLSKDLDTTEYFMAEKRKIQSSRYLPNKEVYAKYINKQEEGITSNHELLLCLKEIINYSTDFEEMGIYLFSWIAGNRKKDSSVQERKTLANLLHSIYYQIKIIQ